MRLFMQNALRGAWARSLPSSSGSGSSRPSPRVSPPCRLPGPGAVMTAPACLWEAAPWCLRPGRGGTLGVRLTGARPLLSARQRARITGTFSPGGPWLVPRVAPLPHRPESARGVSAETRHLALFLWVSRGARLRVLTSVGTGRAGTEEGGWWRVPHLPLLTPKL